MLSRLRRLPHQISSIIEESTDNIRVSAIQAPLAALNLLSQHIRVDFELELILGRHAVGFDLGQVDRVGEMFVAHAILPALRWRRPVVRRRFDELRDVDIGREVDFEVHGDAAVVGVAWVLDVKVAEGHFDDVCDDLVGFGVSRGTQAKLTAYGTLLNRGREGGEACWGEGGEGVGLVEVFVDDRDTASNLGGLVCGVEELVHGFVFGLERIVSVLVRVYVCWMNYLPPPSYFRTCTACCEPDG